jgi:hypothetical protein
MPPAKHRDVALGHRVDLREQAGEHHVLSEFRLMRRASYKARPWDDTYRPARVCLDDQRCRQVGYRVTMPCAEFNVYNLFLKAALVQRLPRWWIRKKTTQSHERRLVVGDNVRRRHQL